ncbi:glycoside hydrolase family 2 protein [Aquimarina agarivorans]|uniref:glycoside hydrolase family 2 protein n=1 Tax=Aquimarina agarivorans TaxID=980584 RepID=UPI000248EB12|nr:glycoside hydrolase family 2 TIM barrel-domain containing protein [Aquimarina agarivorans]
MFKIKAFLLLLFYTATFTAFSQHPFLKHRETLNLSDWKFKKGIIYNANQTNFDDTTWEKVTVPHTYSMDAINDVGYYRGNSWYRTQQILPAEMNEKRIFLRFEAVGQEADVFVNDKLVEQHIGGYAAFCIEITDYIKYEGKNTIAVKVTNEPNYKRIPVNDKLFNHYGGIYRPVQLFATANTTIKPDYFGSTGAFVTLKEHSTQQATVEVKTHISSIEENKTGKLIIDLKNKQNQSIANREISIATLKQDSTITTQLTIEQPKYWQGKENPYLYTAEISIAVEGNEDKISQTFGLKSYKIDPDKGMILNEKPYRLYGVCMHQEWKNEGPALLAKYHKQDIDMVAEIGATAVRLSHYQHSDLTYQLADEKGILVWAEIPFVHDYSGREGENAKLQLKELILQNYNHPSIYVWGLWNEVRAWKSPDEACVVLTKELNELAHQLDPTRLTTSASDRGMESKMGNLTDLQAWNKYYGWYYGTYPDMAKWLDKYHQKYPERPVGISEYGIGGNIYQQDISKLEKPNGNYFPEPEQTKYHEITWDILKDRPFIWSSFVWNMFDFSVAGWNRGGIPNLNHKGLVTFDRKIKKDAFYFYKANWSETPTTHIVGKRNNRRKGITQKIKVYSNQTNLILTANGQQINCTNCNSDTMVVEFDNILLKKGNNLIQVSDTKELTKDAFELYIE